LTADSPRITAIATALMPRSPSGRKKAA